MAAKSLMEAIQKGVDRTVPEDRFLRETIGEELRDFFAHEIMRMQNVTTFLGHERTPTAMELFERVFSDIPAFQVSNKAKVMSE